MSEPSAPRTCDTCLWWGKEQRKHNGENYTKLCNLPASGWYDQSYFEIVNGDPYNQGVLATGPKFGCVRHETSDAPKKAESDHREAIAKIVRDESAKLKKPLDDKEQHAMVEALLCCRNQEQLLECITVCLRNRL